MTTLQAQHDALDSRVLNRIASVADCDPRSVKRVLLGQPTRPAIKRRVLAAIAQLAATLASPQS